ncbi:MAG: L-seryl-tRNA(Sec) selenium transferase [Peptococcaceae bacterium]|nr:L-seryl-tRNA(Sec) selenium transferase [Peptococcaceae bacterium]
MAEHRELRKIPQINVLLQRIRAREAAELINPGLNGAAGADASGVVEAKAAGAAGTGTAAAAAAGQQILARDKAPDRVPDKLLTEAARDILEQFRQDLLAGRLSQAPEAGKIEKLVLEEARRRQTSSLRRVINATGILLHTNLGRAPLAARALAAVETAAAGYSNLEFDLAEGLRGSRYSHVEALLTRLTGAESALVVNNNAGALLLALSALAKGRQVVISRGELVEIGGAFRVPEVMEQSGAILKEVGTTNKTRLGDYAAAVGPETAAILKVHPSNYRIMGFSQSVELGRLTDLGRATGLPVIEDLGSGALLEMNRYGIKDEPFVPDSVAAGADVVTFSGDKLLGGPQAGIIIGKKEYIDIIKRHPLNRALRIDKLSLAALEATLLLYLDESRAEEEVPFLAALRQTPEELRQKAWRLKRLTEEGNASAGNDRMPEAAAGGAAGRAEERTAGEEADESAGGAVKNHAAAARAGSAALILEVVPSESQVGGGSVPNQLLPSFALAVDWRGKGPDALAAVLRHGSPPVVGHISKDRFLLDLRTIGEEELSEVALRLRELAEDQQKDWEEQ